jgi:hypothetical protein
MHDIFEKRPHGLTGEMREMRIDFLATRLWLFRDGSSVRDAARSYVVKMKSAANA